MKKICVLIMLMSISIAMLSTTVKAQSETDGPVVEGASAVNPDQMAVLSGCDNDDQYEDNDYFVYSTKLPFTDHATTGESKTIYATIDKDPFYCLTSIDKDYYYFNLYTRAHITITLSSLPTSVNYNIQLLGSDENLITGSYNSGSTSETIEYDLGPGYYYIYVYSVSGYDNTDTYRLNVTYDSVSSYYNKSIELFQNAGYKAAFWECEFYPFGYSQSTYDGEGVASLVLSYPQADGLDNNIYEELNGEQNVSRVLFLWDQEYKEYLLDDIIDVLLVLEPYAQGTIFATTKLVVSTGALALSILSTALPPLSIGISVAGFFITMLIPSDPIYVNQMYLYLTYLKGVLQATVDDDTVVRIESYYEFYTDYGVDPTIQTYYLNFAINCSPEYNAVYEGTYITYEQEGSKFWGSVNGVKNFSDVEDFMNFIDNTPSGC